MEVLPENVREKMTYNKTVLAQLNKKIVINMIRTQGPINKAEIARKSGLSIPTVMKITDEFEKRKLIRNIGKGESTGGKRPDLLEFIYDAYYIIGVDIGCHSIKIIMMDMASHIISNKMIPTVQYNAKEPEEFLEKIADQIENLILESNIPKEKVMGVGIAIPGILDYKSGSVIFSPDFKWENLQVRELFQRKFPYKIIVENSNKALAIGEFTYGASRGTKNSFCVNIGYGIGAAVIENGKILYGQNGASGEFGHTIMDVNGPVCDCGHRGCLEAISSGNAIARKAKELLENRDNDIASGTLTMGKEIDAKEVFQAAIAGDKQSEQIVEEAIEYLGIAIAGIVNLLDPEMIVLAGGVMKSKHFISKKLLDSINAHRMKYCGKNTRICFSELGDYGTAIGTAAIFMNEFVESGWEY